MPLSQVEDMVDTRLAPKLSQLAGVGLVSISGGQKPAVRIQVNPVALSSYGLNMEDVRTALTQASVNSAKGNFDGPRQDYQIDANDQITTADDYKNVVSPTATARRFSSKTSPTWSTAWRTPSRPPG
jgi:multidrug efflux pump